MKLINYDGITYLPHFILKTDMLDFNKVEYDDESIIIPFKSEIQNNLYFEHIKEILKNKLSEFNFEDSLDNCDEEYSLIICNTEYGYRFKIQALINGCDQYLEFHLNNNEFKIIEPIIQKAFGSEYSIENVRKSVAQKFDECVSKGVLNTLKLMSDTFDKNRYRSAWLTDDNQHCVFASVKDYSKPDCPVEIVKFDC